MGKHNVGQNHGKGVWTGRCVTGKIGYETKARAKRFTKQQNRPGKVYRCPECSDFHVTSMTYREQVQNGYVIEG